MKSSYPPRPHHTNEIELMLDILASVAGDRNAAYLSAPITSGKRFTDWRKRRGEDLGPSQPSYQEELIREVLEPNRAYAQLVARTLRGSFAGVLFDPTAVVDLPGWSQDDYRSLWGRIIERYVRTAVFIDDWQYSNGCAYEFVIAKKVGVITLNQNCAPLSIERGIVLVQKAIEETESANPPSDFLQRALAELVSLRSETAEGIWAK